MTNTANFAILEALGTFETTLYDYFSKLSNGDFEFRILATSCPNVEEQCQKNITMKSILGLSFLLICVCSAYAIVVTTPQYSPETPPEGLYLVRTWELRLNPLGPPSDEDVATLTKTSADTYEFVWARLNASGVGFYSSGTGSFSGGYYEEGVEGREAGDWGWGGFNLHWSGATLSGRYIQFGDKLTGYIIFYPLGSSYNLTSAQTLISKDTGK